MKLSKELDYRIRYDVEHDLFHAQNIFNDEYITPTFIEYVQKLEKENIEMKKQNSKAKELLTRFVMDSVYFNGKEIDLIAEAESFLNGEIKEND